MPTPSRLLMPTPPKPWTRSERIAAIVVTAIVAIVLVLLHHPWYEHTDAAARTLVAARELALGEARLGGTESIPALSYLLAPFAGGDRLDLGRTHALTTACGLIAVALLFAVQRPRSGWPVAALGCLAVAASPGFLLACNRTSEVMPGTALFLACLLVDRWSSGRAAARPAGSPGPNAVLGLAIGSASVVHPVNLLLLPAVLLARSLRRGPGRAAGISVLRDHVPILFGAFAANLGLTNGLGLGLRPQDPSGVPLQGVLEWLGTGLETGAIDSRVDLAWGLVVTVGLVGSCVRRREAGELTALALAFFGFLPSWHLSGPDLLPVLALGLPAGLSALHDAVARHTRRAGVPVAVAGVVAFGWIVTRFDPSIDRGALRAEHEDFVEFVTQVEARLADDSRIASGLGLHLALFLDRPVVAIDPALETEAEDAVEAWLDREAVDTLVLYPRVPVDLDLVRYVLRRYGEREPDRVVTIPPGFLARVRP